MTVIIGLRYDGGVILAADSLVSGGYLPEFIRKPYEFPLETGGVLVAGGAGTYGHIDAAMDNLKSECTTLLASAETQQLAKEAGMRALNRTAKTHGKNLDAQFLVAARCRRTVGLFSLVLNPDTGKAMAQPITRFAVLGSGSYPAQYLFARLWPRKAIPTREQAERMALYVIDELVAAKVHGCGGATRLRTVTAVPFAEVAHASNDKKRQMRALMQPYLAKADRLRSTAIWG